MNIFNPALTARAFLFFAFPAQISGDKVWTFLGGAIFDSAAKVDGYSGATPLAVAASFELACNRASAVESLNNLACSRALLTMISGTCSSDSSRIHRRNIDIGDLDRCRLLDLSLVLAARASWRALCRWLVMGWIFNAVAPAKARSSRSTQALVA